MKLPILMLLGIIVLMASCKKTHICTCTTVQSNGSNTTTNTTINNTNANATTICHSCEKTVGTSTTVCAISG